MVQLGTKCSSGSLKGQGRVFQIRHLCLERWTDNTIISDSSWVGHCHCPCSSGYTHFPGTQTQPLSCFTGQLQEPVWLEVCVSEGTVTMQPVDKQALTSCFCYWTPVISSDWHLVGALVLAHSSAIVHFLIRNLSNRSVHLRVTEKPPSFSLTAFPLPPVLQQLRSSFQFALENGRTRVTQYLKKKSFEESGRNIRDKVFILPKQNEFFYLISKDNCICLDTISSHLLCSTRGHLWLPKHHTHPNSKVLFFQF